MAKELRIPWDANIERGEDRYSDSSRTLSGGHATTKIMDESMKLIDKERTLMGSLGKAPAKPSMKPMRVPDDQQRSFPA